MPPNSIFVQLLAILAMQTKCEPQTPQARIVGGSTIVIEDVPFIVSIQYQSQHFCGGSIIKPNKIITAAHCTDGREASDFSIRAGSTMRESGGQVAQVKKIYQNPNFNTNVNDYDVSILELASNLSFSNTISPITLAQQEIDPNSRAFTFGWGTFRSDSSRLAPELQSVALRIVDKDTCQESYEQMPITERMVCAGSQNGGKDACQGDSGGPLVVDNVLVGITSYGSGCGDPDFPGVYSNVSALQDYIKQYL
ncbi:trypsin-7 [Tribolium castaneum]|uniref:Serine protease P77 n=1 Tax=Tribolium castaneum TaxID=7070 RepID=D2A2R5_TRICA|nr:PREDICTED: trypsin-7 [Tribolium castaneum]EFA02792.1 serine protease P77 [Tribolium castaneum]|eukprot:XP_967167.2 PREDICTED: trypsin-7 [Tribolium castaneum]